MTEADLQRQTGMNDAEAGIPPVRDPKLRSVLRELAAGLVKEAIITDRKSGTRVVITSEKMQAIRLAKLH